MMSICRICNHSGSKHYPDCPFSNIPPKRNPNSSIMRWDYWLDTDDGRKQTQKDFEQGKVRYLGNYMFERVE